jgi:hypothetical protein
MKFACGLSAFSHEGVCFFIHEKCFLSQLIMASHGPNKLGVIIAPQTVVAKAYVRFARLSTRGWGMNLSQEEKTRAVERNTTEAES